ncbi:hypothetical protein AAC387_Pa07g0483 [Persea americana]
MSHHKRRRSESPNPPSNHHQLQLQKKKPTFISYLDVPNLPHKIRLLCEILSTTPSSSSSSLESALSSSGIRPSPSDVEQVLKLSYSSPTAAVKFFRWAGLHLIHHHSPYSWNLVVDLLGKNHLFDAMWDAIKSMRSERILSLATFASVFSSYAAAGRVDEAFITFDLMDQYGWPRDIVALNSLLSAICRDFPRQATDFLARTRQMIRPDPDTYAILLEGWETVGDATNARRVFDEMLALFGWDPANVPAYDSFLNTLLKSPGGVLDAMRFFEVMRDKRCYPGMKFFRNALEEFSRTSNHRDALVLWEEMVGRNRRRPDTQMYNLMIELQCHANRLELAQRLLDDMVFDGAFPNSETYNVFLQYMIKNKRLREIATVFKEMVKNEFLPTHANCASAIKLFLDSRNPDMAIMVWKCMVGNDIGPLEDCANFLVVELPHAYRLAEAVKYAEDMIERGIKLNSSTLSKLKQNLTKVGKVNAYDQILRKWKLH